MKHVKILNTALQAYGKKDISFAEFDNGSEVLSWVESIKPKMKRQNLNILEDHELNTENGSQNGFLGINSLDELSLGRANKNISFINDIVEKKANDYKIKHGGKFGAIQLKPNDRQLGSFSFDLASIGLLKKKEYYSEYLKQTVDADYVKKENEVYYFSDGLTEKHEVVQRDMLNEFGKPIFFSTNRKSYLNFENNENKEKDRASKYYTIIVPCAFAARVSASDIQYNGMAALVVAKILTDAKYKIRIQTIFGVYDKEKAGNNGLQLLITNVKGYKDPIDINGTSNIICSTQYMRNNLLLASSALRDYEKNGFNATLEIGSAMNNNNSILAHQMYEKTQNPEFSKTKYIYSNYVLKTEDIDLEIDRIFNLILEN